MEITREVSLLIDNIRKASGSQIPYHGYKLDRRFLREKIGIELEQEIFDIYWKKEEMEYYELKETKTRLVEILKSILTNKISFTPTRKNQEPK